MSSEYVLLTEKEEMWARMLMEVLEDNNIPCIAVPVYGAGFAAKTGQQDVLKIYVPFANLPLASQYLEELFAADFIWDNEEFDS